jgi:hypothetical protein
MAIINRFPIKGYLKSYQIFIPLILIAVVIIIAATVLCSSLPSKVYRNESDNYPKMLDQWSVDIFEIHKNNCNKSLAFIGYNIIKVNVL